MIMKKILKKFSLLCIILVLFFCAFTKTNVKAVTVDEDNNDEISKLDYTSDCIIVEMKHEISEINKVYDESFFGNIDIEEITDLTYINNPDDPNLLLNRDNFNQILKITLVEKTKDNVNYAINVVSQNQWVESVTPNYIIEFEIDDNLDSDSLIESILNEENNYWGLIGEKGIQANKAWEYTKGNNIKVAVIDTGLIQSNKFNTGKVSVYDFFASDTPDPIENLWGDPYGHGTKVSSIIGGLNTGVSPEVELIMLQVWKYNSSDKTVSFERGDFTNAVTWCINNDIDVINFSAGKTITNTENADENDNEITKNTDYYSSLLKDYAGVIVMSAGNTNNDNDVNPHYPSELSYNHNNMISVGAMNSSGERWVDKRATGEKLYASNYGQTKVTIFAPGEEVCVITNSDTYKNNRGTSIAAPYVSGTVALALSVINQLDNKSTLGSVGDISADIKELIIKNAVIENTPTDENDDAGSLYNLCVAHGYLNAFRVVSAIALDYNVSNEELIVNGFQSGITLMETGVLEIPDKVAPYDNGTVSNLMPITGINVSAFKDNTSIKKVVIPSNITSIGNGAFEGCINLEEVEILDNISNLGEEVFKGCDNLKTIYVPASLFYLYINNEKMEPYKHLLQPIDGFDEISLDCLNNDIEDSFDSEIGTKVFKVTSDCTFDYNFTFSGYGLISAYLYDEDFNLIEEKTINNDVITFADEEVSNDFFIIVSCNPESIGTVFAHFENNWLEENSYLEYGDTSIRSCAHGDETITQPLIYQNNNDAGFYKFTLNYSNSNEISLDSGSISIYMDRDEYFEYEINSVSNNSGENFVYVYLGYQDIIYVELTLINKNIDSLTLNITSIQEEEVDLFDCSEMTESLVYFISGELNNSLVEKLILKQSGLYRISVLYSNNKSSINNFVLLKQNYNMETNKYCLEPIISYEDYADELESELVESMVLEEGIYYIGYFNKNAEEDINVTIHREISQWGSNAIVSDPVEGSLCGSQINIIESELDREEKSYRGDNILEGFTRVLYLDLSYAPSDSRLNYWWYTSNENILTVTPYGTILAMPVEQNEVVEVMAVYKENPAITFVKEFTVQNDLSNNIIEIELNQTHEVTEGKYKITMPSNMVPYNWIQYYSWDVQPYGNIEGSLNIWGELTVSDIGYFVITGTYLLNPRVKVIINLTLTSLDNA